MRIDRLSGVLFDGLIGFSGKGEGVPRRIRFHFSFFLSLVLSLVDFQLIFR